MCILSVKNNIFLLGIGGIGVSALARYFKALGKNVAGYDKTKTNLTEQLESEGISVIYDEDINLVPKEFVNNPETTHIVYSPAISSNNKLYKYFNDNGFQLDRRGKVLGEVVSFYKAIAVSGTHGKTTNSSVIANILGSISDNYFAFLGGISNNLNSNLHFPINQQSITDKNLLAVVEADEYDRAFLWLKPYVSIVTYLDSDHLDIYKDRNEIIKTFNEFVNNTDENGSVIVNKKVDDLINVVGGRKKLTYSDVDTSADYYAKNIRLQDGFYTIDAVTPNGILENIKIGARGRVNVENTLACIAATQAVGINQQYIRKGIETFRGVKRRMEICLQTPNIVYIDDYAHHPRELSATIKSVKEMFPNKKITGIFQPHLYSRTRDLADEFAESLDLLYQLILTDIYPARELPIEGVDSSLIANRMKKCNVVLANNFDKIIEIISNSNVEVLLTLGAGNISDWVNPIKDILKNKYC